MSDNLMTDEAIDYSKETLNYYQKCLSLLPHLAGLTPDDLKQAKVSTLHTAHCTLHTAHCTLHTAHCTLHTAHCTLHAHHTRMRAHTHAHFMHHRTPSLLSQELL
jgi:hypothetical protein